jgi:hypothetical protein
MVVGEESMEKNDKPTNTLSPVAAIAHFVSAIIESLTARTTTAGIKEATRPKEP